MKKALIGMLFVCFPVLHGCSGAAHFLGPALSKGLARNLPDSFLEGPFAAIPLLIIICFVVGILLWGFIEMLTSTQSWRWLVLTSTQSWRWLVLRIKQLRIYLDLRGWAIFNDNIIRKNDEIDEYIKNLRTVSPQKKNRK